MRQIRNCGRTSRLPSSRCCAAPRKACNIVAQGQGAQRLPPWVPGKNNNAGCRLRGATPSQGKSALIAALEALWSKPSSARRSFAKVAV